PPAGSRPRRRPRCGTSSSAGATVNGLPTATPTSPPHAEGGLGFAGRVVGVAPGGVVGRVEDFGDLGDLFLDQPLDALLERDVRGATALAAAAHLQIHAVILHVHELDESAVAGDRGIDHRIDQLLNLGLQIIAHAAPLHSILQQSSCSGPTGPPWAPLSKTTAR